MADEEVKTQMVQHEEEEKWVTWYSSNHQILLVGEGDFSFSLCLAQSFGSASNIVASSLDSYDDVIKKYKEAKSNLYNLKKLGACLLHGVDATRMKLHPDLHMRRFDRVIYNFPHAGFRGREDNLFLIKKHKNLVLGFFVNSSSMLRANGEIHVNHKTTPPFTKWNIEKLASQCLLTLIECAGFKKEDYPGYNNKRGDGSRCDEPFPLGECSTFKFIYNPRASKQPPKMRNRTGSTRQRNPPLQENIAMEQWPASVRLNYHPQSSHKMSSVICCGNGYSSSFGGYTNNVAERLGGAAPDTGYSFHGRRPDFEKSLQPLSPSINVGFPQIDYVRKMDMVPSSLSARNELYEFCGGRSSYMAESLGRTSQRAGYSFHEVRPDYERYIAELQPLSPSINVGFPQIDYVRKMDMVPSSLSARNELYEFCGGRSSYMAESLGRTSQRTGYSFHEVRPDYERYITELPGRSFNGDIYIC